MNKIYKPDLNAPRFKKKVVTTLNAEFIKKVREVFPQYNYLTNEEIKSIIQTFNTNIYKTVIDKRDGVELPSQIGHIFIGTCPPSKRRYNVDLKTSFHYMQKVQHRNWESDQHIAKIFFTTFGNKYRFKNHDLWAFDSCRIFSREVSATYPVKWKQYVKVDPRVKISNIFKSINYKMTKEEEEFKALDDYNEFEL
jgi:hypothetical protein